jgi:XTP/dITP diphosphohydrolase
MSEFKREFGADNTAPQSQTRAMEEFGDLLFSLVNYARFIRVHNLSFSHAFFLVGGKRLGH